jgi:hypothetical protein
MVMANEHGLSSVLPRKRLRGDHCRCGTCGQEFNSTKAFDRHRVGDYADESRRCLSIAEMKSLGMVKNAGGWWITERRENAGSSLRRNSRSDDLAGPVVQDSLA